MNCACPQMTRMHECVGEVQDMLGAAYQAFLGVLRPLQQARGSVTSGCVLTDVIVIGMRLGAYETHSSPLPCCACHRENRQ